MTLFVDKLIDPKQCREWADTLDGAAFHDGAETAGWLARTAKDNEQLAPGALYDEITQTIDRAIMTHPLLRLHLRPARMTPLRISRYRKGMAYGRHVDDARISGVRTDLSFTLFLTAPDSYEGGSLRLYGTDGVEEIKLDPGQAIFYPSGDLHEVTEVTDGERLVIVGWLQSRIQDPRHRDILADIEQSRNSLFERGTAPDEVLALSKALTNLQRLWQDS